MAVVVGIDGAGLGDRRGWVATRLVDRSLDEIAFFDSLVGLLETFDRAEVVGVDAPIGHDDPSGEKRGGRRRADVEARKALDERSSSVFPVPPIDLLEADEHAQASRQAEKRGTIKPTARVWAMRERILETNRVAEADDRLVEVHPELGFHVLGMEQGGLPAQLASKRSWDGLAARIDLLDQVGLSPSGPLGTEAGLAGPDDVLDSIVAAWSADRVARGSAIPFPRVVVEDPGTGRRVAIHA